MKTIELINKVDDGFNYFNSGFIEELTNDKFCLERVCIKYYVKVFMDYIEYLEKRTLQLNNNNLLDDMMDIIEDNSSYEKDYVIKEELKDAIYDYLNKLKIK